MYSDNLKNEQLSGFGMASWLAEELKIIRLEEGLTDNIIASMMCRVVNLAMVARLNQYYSHLSAIGLRALNVRHTISYRSFHIEHVVGYCYHPELDLHFTFDGTADQILGVGHGIQICYGVTFDESVQQMNSLLGINITQQIVGPQSYSQLY